MTHHHNPEVILPTMTKSYLKENNLKELFKSFQISCYGIDPKTSNPIVRKTTRARLKKGAASKLHATAFRLCNGALLLDGVVNTLRDGNSIKKSLKYSAKLIENSIIPLMGKAANLTKEE